MKEDQQDQPYFRASSAPPLPTELPGSPLLTGNELTLRRPSPYALGAASLSTHSRFSSAASPQPPSSSRTSYSVVDQARKHINIGIDFGTTFSGVSWAISGAPETEICTVSNWPGGQAVKVPTEISYDKNTIQWGYAIASEAERLSWFKLLLAEETLPPDIRDSKQLRATRKLLKKLGLGAVGVTADYLRLLWDWALADIRKEFANSVDAMPFRIVLSVPANWPKTAVDNMRNAAEQAGLLKHRAAGGTKLEFVGEPEAAAVAAFFEGNIRHNVRAGDIVVICDAGGGTVDIVTYEVTRVQPSVTLGESICGDMGLCGSIFLDEGFMKYMESMLGKDKLEKLPKATYGELMNTWEHKIKRQYHKDSTGIARPIPHEVAKAIKSPLRILKKGKGSKQLTGDTFHFSPEDIGGIFDPVMTDILKLAFKQRNETMKKRQKKPSAILLVGGLGGNQYLYERLQKESSTGNSHIDVLQPSGPNVWASICRGAAIKGMTFDDIEDQPLPVVTSYISKAHYGMMYKEPFDASKHTDEDRKEWCPAKEQDLAWDQMHWYVTKGHDVSQGKPVEMTWEFAQLESRSHGNYSIIIYECEATVAPSRKTTDVHECASITFPARRNNLAFREGAEGQRFRVVRFTVRMTLLGLGRLDFATYVDGELVAKKDVRVKLGSE